MRGCYGRCYTLAVGGRFVILSHQILKILAISQRSVSYAESQLALLLEYFCDFVLHLYRVILLLT